MRLIGVLLSPYVRRVAVSLKLLQLPFELDDVFVFAKPDAVRRHNPLVRIPALILDDGTDLIESGAILDEIDHMVHSEQRLIPTDGQLRRSVLQTIAMAIGCAEKAQSAFYEDRVRPPEKVHTNWIDHNDRQVLGGFEHLNAAAAKIPDQTWISETESISQADITTAVAFTFANTARPNLKLAERFPELSQFTARCEGLEAFRDAPFPTDSQLGELLRLPFVV